MASIEKKLKILYIITKSNWGGAQRYVFDLATHLPKDQFEPIVVLGGSGLLKEKLEMAGIQTITLPDLERDMSLTKEVRAFLNICSVLKKIKPDIVHLNSSKAGGLGALAARFYNLSLKLSTFNFTLSTSKVLFTAHGFAFKEKRKPLIKKILEYLSWLTILLSDTTIVVSQDDKEKAGQFLFVQPKIVLIHNGIGSIAFKEKDKARQMLAGKTPVAANSLWIGTIGELHKNKGLEYAIAAIGKIVHQETARKIKPEGILYVVLGGGEERSNLEAFIQREKLEGTIILAGERPEAAELLKAFDIFLIPSLKEGLPYVLLEAGQAGLPTVATSVGGIPEVVKDMVSGIILKEKRPKEIADALTFLIEHPEKMKEFGEELQKTVREKFTLQGMVEKTIAIYSGI